MVGFGAAVSFALLFRWDGWYLNFDGGTYLAMAKSLLTGSGYRLPDGSFATFRGPLFSLTLAAGWLVLPMTVKSAIWVSRVVIVANAAVTAGLTRRVTGRVWLALAAGMLIAVQPLPLISGAMFLVPDALSAFFVLCGIWLWIGPRNSDAAPTRLRMALAGFTIGLAFLTKETAALALVIPIVIEVRRSGLSSIGRSLLYEVAGWLAPVATWTIVVLVAAGRLPDWAGGIGASRLTIGGGLMVTIVVAYLALTRRSPGRGDGVRSVHPLVLVVAMLIGSIAVLAVVGARLVLPVGELGDALVKDWDRWMYLGAHRGWLLIAFLPALLWSFGRERSSEVMAALGLVTVGFAQLAHAALAQLGPRNGVVFAYGSVLLIALWIQAMWSADKWRLALRTVSIAAFAVLLVVSYEATNRTDGRFDFRGLTSDASAVREASKWMEGIDLPVAGTPDFLSFMWFLQGGTTRYDLIRFLTADPPEANEQPNFSRLASWAGHTVPQPGEAYSAIGATVARSGIGLVSGASFRSDPGTRRLVVLTGNLQTSASVFDGGVLIPFMEAQPNAHKVYQSSMEQLPQWIVIYQVDGRIVPDVRPVLVHMGVDVPTPVLASDQIVMSDDQYRKMVTSVLASPTY